MSLLSLLDRELERQMRLSPLQQMRSRASLRELSSSKCLFLKKDWSRTAYLTNLFFAITLTYVNVLCNKHNPSCTTPKLLYDVAEATTEQAQCTMQFLSMTRRSCNSKRHVSSCRCREVCCWGIACSIEGQGKQHMCTPIEQIALVVANTHPCLVC